MWESGSSSVLRRTSNWNISLKKVASSRFIRLGRDLNLEDEKYASKSSPWSGAPSAFDAPAPRNMAILGLLKSFPLLIELNCSQELSHILYFRIVPNVVA